MLYHISICYFIEHNFSLKLVSVNVPYIPWYPQVAVKQAESEAQSRGQVSGPGKPCWDVGTLGWKELMVLWMDKILHQLVSRYSECNYPIWSPIVVELYDTFGNYWQNIWNTVWLVVWNISYFSIRWESTSQLTFIFFRRVGQPPTSCN